MKRFDSIARLSRACLLLLIAAAAQSAQAQRWNDNDHTAPKFWGTPMAPKVVYTHKTVDDAHSSANAAFWSDKFAKLDAMYDEFLDGHLRATDGTWMIEAFGRTFDEYGGAKPELVDEAFAHWAAKSPGSRLRPVAEAIVWESRAWAARGGGGASSVPRESQQMFQERLRRAAQALRAAEPEGRESPLWYWVALIVAGSSGQPAPVFDALFEEAVTRFPYYQPLYYTRMNYYLPQWGGSYEAVDRFIRDSVARTSAEEGDSFYVWLYLDIAKRQRGDLFSKTRADWPSMKKGFEDMIARHPDTWNVNVYATWACQVRDRETTARLLVQLGNKAALGAWSPGVTTESCQRFALTQS